MPKSNWNTNDIPDQTGRVMIITGATSGLGKEASRVLADKGASIIMAVRNIEKGQRIAKGLNGDIRVRTLDLSSLDSIRDFAGMIQLEIDRLDVLINNAGVMMCPYSKTVDGFEIQMGTNHLGHFALTGLLMPLLKKTNYSRVVATSSLAHSIGNIDFSDLHWENRKYNTNKAYADSKLANLYFTYELARKCEQDPAAPIVTAAHPGWTKTDLQRHSGLFSFLNNFLSQKVDKGTLPTLRAATDPNVKSGDYYGPSKFFEMHGNPQKVDSNNLSKDTDKAAQLWEASERLTGIHY